VDLSISIVAGRQFLYYLCLPLCNDVDVLVLFPFIDDPRVSSKGLMLESLGKLIKFILLSFNIYFRVSKEENL
jgi:hypothetical protein